MPVVTPVRSAIALGAVVCLVVLLLFPAAPDSHPSQSIVRAMEVKSAQVRVEARLDSNRLEDDSADTLRVTVLNDSLQPLTSLHLGLSAPGFALEQKSLPCRHLDGSVSPDQPLPSHQSCEFAVPLSAAARSGLYGITAVVDWRQSDTAGRATLILGPVTIDRSLGAAKWTRLARRLALVLKDLTLPIIVAILGAWFTTRQGQQEAQRRKDETDRENARRDRETALQDARIAAEKDRELARIAAEKEADLRRIDAERDKEDARRVAQTAQVERQEVRRLLLTRVMELAEQHYLPFVTHARVILIEAGKIRDKKPDAAPDKLFLHVLFLLKRMDIFRLTKGGIFFKTRGGERAVGAAWYLLKVGIYSALGDENTASALKLVRIKWDYATYKTQLTTLDPAWTEFQSWLAEPENSTKPTGSFWQILGILDAFQAVMLFEADKPLSTYWYEEDSAPTFLLPAPTLFYKLPSTNLYAETQTSELILQLNSLYSRSTQIKQLP
jgi:hypothetical protein